MKKYFIGLLAMAAIAITMIVMWPTNKSVGNWEGTLHGLVDARGSETYQGIEYRTVLSVSNDDNEQYYKIEKETKREYYIDNTGNIYVYDNGMHKTGKRLDRWFMVH